jgi:alkylation response protein AidB-like acyl-CoA dehydrogenase
VTTTTQLGRSAETPGFRDDVRAFLREHLSSDWQGIGAMDRAARAEFVAHWRQLCAAERLLAVTWDEQYGGRGLGKLDHLAVVEEFAAAKVPLGVPGDTVSIKIFGNTLNKWGSPEQKQRFLPRIISGEDIWCQGYSEPESGSDLSNLRTRAELVGAEWVINGQKTWTSNAHNANWMFLLVRTDQDAPKTKGITMIIMPTGQSGVDIRPISMVTGASEFNEVFLTDARTAAENVVGAVNEGWVVANSLLAHERGEEAAINPVLFAQELSRVIDLMRDNGRAADPLMRLRLAKAFSEVTIMKALGDQILDQYIRDGSLGSAASISKLFWSEYHKKVTDLAVDALGDEALVWQGDPPLRWFRADDPGSPNDSATWLTVYLANAMSGTVYAGTSEIQRNIIGERILGLPREARPV